MLEQSDTAAARSRAAISHRWTPMTALEDAILRTILYADVFNFALTLDELHHFLIASVPVSAAQIEQAIGRSARLQSALACVDGLFMRAGREELAALRQTREQASAALWEPAARYGRWIGRMPFVRMVALTGALAVRNAVAHDDIDYVIVTAERRVWLARALTIVIVRLARLRGVHLCPNYLLAETALRQDRRDLYMAHEIAQMIPVYGHDLHARMRRENAWVTAHLPNAGDALHRLPTGDEGRGWQLFKRTAERLLGGALGDAFERWERERKLRRFAPHVHAAGSDAQLDDARVKGHFQDHGHPVLDAYAQRLALYAIVENDAEFTTTIG